MFRNTTSSRKDRRAIILLVVVTLLTLFAVVGISFVIYAENTASSGQAYNASQQGGHTTVTRPTSRGNHFEEPPIPTDLFNTVLGQLIYDLPDDRAGVYSSLRGHSLARAMYSILPPNPTGTAVAQNKTPYNGFGRFHHSAQVPPTLSTNPVDLHDIVHYHYFPNDVVVFDPESRATRPNLTTLPQQGNHVQKNAPYTYPDLNNFYLAAVDARGRVITPSFHRQYLFGALNDTNNPNWTSPIGKYKTLRPRPADHVWPPGSGAATSQFPYPSDPGGDVKNLLGAPGGNDSIWIDFDSPVRAWNGKLYKALAAILVVDMDGRVSLNVAGNHRNGAGHTSNQGIGPWEASLERVLNNQQEALAILQGATTASPYANFAFGRYGRDATTPKQPNKVYASDITTPPTEAPQIFLPPFYARVDWDGDPATAAGGNPQITMPQAQQTSPIFPGRYRYGYVTPANMPPIDNTESINHALLFNPFLLRDYPSPTVSDPLKMQRDRIFGYTEMAALTKRFNYDPDSYLFSDLGRLAQSSLGQNTQTAPPNNINRRWLVTTHSHDFDRVGMIPWRQNGPSSYQFPQGTRFPAGQPLPPPDFNNPPNGQTGDGDFKMSSAGVTTFGSAWPQTVPPAPTPTEFDPNGIDITRPLADYPATPPAQGPLDPAFVRPHSERIGLAQAVFHRLCRATGASPSTPPGTPEGDAVRWLAQLAVNIVDYVDRDEIMTPFNYLGAEYVFGTEQPRLVINETYMQYSSDDLVDPSIIMPAQGQMPKASYFDVKVWVELHNPLTPQAGGSDAAALSQGGNAQITINGTPGYRILLTKPNANLRARDNRYGWPDGFNPNDPNHANNPTMVPNDQVFSFTPTLSPGVPNASVPPNTGADYGTVNAGAIQNASFALVGPENLPDMSVNNTASPPELKYRASATAPGQPVRIDPNTMRPIAPSVLLQRLANPLLTHQPDPAQPGYNPFITVDYVTGIPQMMNNAAKHDTVGPIMTPETDADHEAWGRKEPLVGHIAMNLMQQPNPPPAGIKHTFGRHNGTAAGGAQQGDPTLNVPFQWYAHLDRPPISPLELTTVSAFKPHELTQVFADGPPMMLQPQQHLVNWFDNNTRLYRAFDFLRCNPQMYGLGGGGRIPGRININTIWDKEVWDALVDPQSANFFTQTETDAVWGRLLQSRSPGMAQATPQIMGTDRPFLPAASPINPGGDPAATPPTPPAAGSNSFDINNTLLRIQAPPTVPGANPSLLLQATSQSTPTHPYFQNELLNKIWGNVTTKSNVFAIWCTIGYFEVRNPGPYNDQNPPILGKEMGADDGANIRHRFFSIVDRSNLSVTEPPPPPITTPPTPPTLPQPGPPPVFFSLEPKTAGGELPPNQDIQVRVPATRLNSTTNAMEGDYDGYAWSIGLNTQLRIGVTDQIAMPAGPNEVQGIRPEGSEIVSVQGTTFTAGGATNPLPYGEVTIRLGKRHYRGEVMQLLAPPNGTQSGPGNPGPQPNFNFRAPLFTGVVRYFSQLN